MNTYYRTALAGITGLVLTASACSPTAKPEAPEFVLSYTEGKTEFQVYGKGQRDRQTGIHPTQMITYQTISDGKGSNIEVICKADATVWNWQKGQLERKINIAAGMNIDGHPAMIRPERTQKKPLQFEIRYLGIPEADGPFNAQVLNEVGEAVCKTAALRVYDKNKENAAELKADREKEIRDNTERIKPR